MKLSEYFLESNRFRFLDRIRDGENPWSAIGSIRSIIEAHLETIAESGIDSLEQYCRLESVPRPEGGGKEFILSIQHSFAVLENIHIRNHNIFIGKGSTLEAGAMIKAPCVIGERCQIRQGAYIRGDVIVGDNCVVGHTTEVKNSIFMDDTCAGHFSYVGDSILGSKVNLGAGTKIANLQFRTKEEIDEGGITEIIIRTNNENIGTGMGKLGAVIGDYSEIGCNTVTSPGSIIGAHCWVHPNTTLPKGFYKPGSVIKNEGGASIIISHRQVQS